MAFAPTSLTMQDAAGVLQQGLAAVAAGQREIDLGQLASLDSSALAALLAWQRAAESSGSRLVFTNLPASLQSLAQLYGVDKLLA